MDADMESREHLERELRRLRDRVAELEQSEARYRSLFEHSPISLWEEDFSAVKRIIDALKQRGVDDLDAYFKAHPDEVAHCATLVRIIDVNTSSIEVYGANDKETLFAGLPKIFDAQALATFHEELIAFARGRTSFEYETSTQMLDGRNCRILIRIIIPTGYEESWGRVFVAILDVTQRAQAAEAQRRAALQEEIIRAQQDALSALSTPVIPISDDILVMPLVGALDRGRMDQVLGALLEEVQRRRASMTIIDITGVPTLGLAVADALVRTAQAVRLLGARVMLTGIRPEVAQALVGLGVDLQGITTHGTLQAGIAQATRGARAR